MQTARGHDCFAYRRVHSRAAKSRTLLSGMNKIRKQKPKDSGTVVEGEMLICLPLLCDIIREWVVGIWCAQQRLDGE